MNKKITTLILALGFTSIADAGFARSSTIPLDDAKAGPGEYALIDFKKLYEGVTYDLTCTIANETNPSTTGVSSVIFHLEPLNNSNSLSITDYNYTKYDAPQDFKSSGSVFKIYNINSTYKPLSIRNIDFTDTIKVFNCFAELH